MIKPPKNARLVLTVVGLLVVDQMSETCNKVWTALKQNITIHKKKLIQECYLENALFWVPVEWTKQTDKIGCKVMP